jgi:hypothetical protein
MMDESLILVMCMGMALHVLTLAFRNTERAHNRPRSDFLI